MEIQSETQFYQDGAVTVTQSRFVTQSKTYAMRNISSVYVFEIEKNRANPIIMILIGIPFLFSGNIFWIGLIIITLGILWLISIKNEYAVRISTNAGETNSILSRNITYIQKIVDALNDAIIYRG